MYTGIIYTLILLLNVSNCIYSRRNNSIQQSIMLVHIFLTPACTIMYRGVGRMGFDVLRKVGGGINIAPLLFGSNDKLLSSAYNTQKQRCN